MTAKKIALFIDADNISAKFGKQIFDALENRGEIFIRRIYGNWEKFSLHGWNDCILNFSLRPVQQIDFASGKNATDMSLTIDAMDVLHDSKAEVFALVSNDSDFTPLAIRLREGGMSVIGLGGSQVSNSFRAACSEFIDLDAPAELQPAQPTPEVVKKVQPAQPTPEVVKKVQPAQTTPEVVKKVQPVQPTPEVVKKVQPAQPTPEVVKKVQPAQPTPEVVKKVQPAQPTPEVVKKVQPVQPTPEVVKKVQPAQMSLFIENKASSPKPTPATSKVVPITSQARLIASAKRIQVLHNALREAAVAHGDEKGFVPFGFAGQFLSGKKIKVKKLGFGSLNKFVAAFPDLYEVIQRDTGENLCYRCRKSFKDEKIDKLHEILRKTAQLHRDATGFTDLSHAGNSIGKQKIGFGIRELGYSTLQKFICSFPNLYDVRKKHKKVFYCCRPLNQQMETAERLRQLHRILRETAETHRDEAGFSLLNHAGQAIKNKKLGYGIKDFGYNQLRDFISDFPDLYEITQDKTGQHFRYRCR